MEHGDALEYSWKSRVKTNKTGCTSFKQQVHAEWETICGSLAYLEKRINNVVQTNAEYWPAQATLETMIV